MSRDLENQRTLDAARELPGRGDDATDDRRGYVGWEPGEDAGATVVHADWPAYLADAANTDRVAVDFYFACGHPSEPCGCCDGSGATKGLAALRAGFRGPRGWGRGALTQDEVDALVAERLVRVPPGGAATPAGVRRLLGVKGCDSLKEAVLVAARARRLGLDRPCAECFGEGELASGPERISLSVWTADPARGWTRMDAVARVDPRDLDEVRCHMQALGIDGLRERFGWATRSNMFPQPRFAAPETGWGPGRGGMRMGGDWWDDGISYATWADFASEFSEADTDLNLPIDFHFTAPPGALDGKPSTPRGDHLRLDDGELPAEFGIDVWMSHPRKGADRAIRVRSASRAEAGEIRDYFAKAAAVHERHFGWASGNYPEPGGEPAADGGPGPRR